MQKALAAALALVVIILFGVACEGEAKAPVSPSPGALEVASFPRVVRDMMGREVAIPARPQRVIATSPTTTELVYVLGGEIVARVTSANYPPQVVPLPTIGSTYNPNWEAILAQKPDLIVADSVNQRQLIDRLTGLGVPVVMAGAESFQDVLKAIEVVGKALGRDEEAQRAIKDLQDQRQSLLAYLPQGPGPRVLILIADADGNIYAAKPNSYVGSLAQELRVQNPVAGLPDSGPFPGYTLLSPELALQADPDVILALSPAPPPAPKLSQLLPRLPGFGSLRAVKEGKVYELDLVLFLQSPGPRVVEAMRSMASMIYPQGGR